MHPPAAHSAAHDFSYTPTAAAPRSPVPPLLALVHPHHWPRWHQVTLHLAYGRTISTRQHRPRVRHTTTKKLSTREIQMIANTQQLFKQRAVRIPCDCPCFTSRNAHPFIYQLISFHLLACLFDSHDHCLSTGRRMRWSACSHMLQAKTRLPILADFFRITTRDPINRLKRKTRDMRTCTRKGSLLHRLQ